MREKKREALPQKLTCVCKSSEMKRSFLIVVCTIRLSHSILWQPRILNSMNCLEKLRNPSQMLVFKAIMVLFLPMDKPDPEKHSLFRGQRR